MHSPATAHPAPPATATPAETSPAPLPDAPVRARNFWVLAWYQVLMRIGWIFKTESVVMPAVLDALGCGPMLRGFLPLLNRFGQSVPPLLLSQRIRGTAYKKLAMALCAALMSAAFVLLAFFWFVGGDTGWWLLPYAFLAVYALFFMSTGVHQLCFGALQGKLVPANRRGRLMLAANVIGATCACGAAWTLMPRWLHAEGGQFQYIFGVSGICFLAAAAWSLLLVESPDDFGRQSKSIARLLADARQTLRQDANFRRLAIVAALFGFSMMLFPHYQALARERLGLTFQNLMVWVVVQNAGTAAFSLVVGPLADWRGNRLVLLFVLLTICAAPISAIALAYAGAWGRFLFPLVFLLVGLTPNAIRTFTNYTLEICKPADHPRYLSTLSLLIAAPVFLSPLVGLLIGLWGFEPVFLCLTGLILAGWLLAFGLDEPRSQTPAPRGSE